MVRSIFVFLYLLFVVIAHSFFSDLDYSGFSWLPDEVSSFFSSPDDSGEADSYSFDPSVYNSQNDWEVSSDSAQQDLYAWEPPPDNEYVSSVQLSAIEETDSSDDGYFDQDQYQSEEPDLSPMTPYTGDLCTRESSTSVNGAMCHYEPQCDNGRLPMCCSKMTIYGRPTECTRYNPFAFKCISDQGEHVYCCRPGFISGIIGNDCVKWW